MAGKGLLSGGGGLKPYKSTSMGPLSDTERDGDRSGVIGVDGPLRVWPREDE